MLLTPSFLSLSLFLAGSGSLSLATPQAPATPLSAHLKTGRPVLNTLITTPTTGDIAQFLVDAPGSVEKRRMDLVAESSRYKDVLSARQIYDAAVVARMEHGAVVRGGRRAHAGAMRKRGGSACKASSSSTVEAAKTSLSTAKTSLSTAETSSSIAKASSSSSLSSASASHTSSAIKVQAQVIATSSSKASQPSAHVTTTTTSSVATHTSTKTSSAVTITATSATSVNTAAYATSTLFTSIRTTGDLTYYAQGQTSCGSVYTDESYTAAVSHLLYDAWPGATVNTNRNPICGPFVSGRIALDGSVLVAGTDSVLVGGDNLLNCIAGEMCHIPLTATLTYKNTSVQVQIVDRCEGCAVEDIDVTPTVFLALTGNMDLGRIKGTSGDFKWSFDQ